MTLNNERCRRLSIMPLAFSISFWALYFVQKQRKNIDNCQGSCYNTVSTILLCFETEEQYHKECAEQKRKEKRLGVPLRVLFFVVAVMARLVGDYVSKWLDSK